MRLCRYEGWVVVRTLQVSERSLYSMRLTSVETGGWEWFDNSTCERVLDLLEPDDLRLGQVVIKKSSNSQAWSEQWKWRSWKLFWYRGMDGYSEADEW